MWNSQLAFSHQINIKSTLILPTYIEILRCLRYGKIRQFHLFYVTINLHFNIQIATGDYKTFFFNKESQFQIKMRWRFTNTYTTINIFFKGTKTVQYLRNYFPHTKDYLNYSLPERKSIIQWFSNLAWLHATGFSPPWLLHDWKSWLTLLINMSSAAKDNKNPCQHPSNKFEIFWQVA